MDLGTDPGAGLGTDPGTDRTALRERELVREIRHVLRERERGRRERRERITKRERESW